MEMEPEVELEVVEVEAVVVGWMGGWLLPYITAAL